MPGPWLPDRVPTNLPAARSLLFDEDVAPMHRTIDDVEFDRALRKVGVGANALVLREVFHSMDGTHARVCTSLYSMEHAACDARADVCMCTGGWQTTAMGW